MRVLAARRCAGTLVEALVALLVSVLVIGSAWAFAGFQIRHVVREDAFTAAVAGSERLVDRLRADLRRLAPGPESPACDADGRGFRFEVFDVRQNTNVRVRYLPRSGEIEIARGAQVHRLGGGLIAEASFASGAPGVLEYRLVVHAPPPRHDALPIAGRFVVASIGRRGAFAFWSEAP